MLSSQPIFRCLSRRLLVTDRKAVQCQLCLHRKHNQLLILRRRLLLAAQAQVATPVAVEQDGAPPQVVESGEQHAARPEQASTNLSSKADKRPRVGTTLQLECEGISSEGKGVCKTAEGLVVFVPRAIPGETLTAVVTNAGGGSARAKKLETLKESPHRVQAPCQRFPACGGCSLQDLAYPVQLEQKQQHVKEALRRIGRVQNIDKLMQPPVACEDTFHYRNKMTFSVSSSQDSLRKRQRLELGETPLVGLHAAEDANEIIAIETCWLQDETSNRILALVKGSIPQVQQKGRLAVQKVVIRKGANYVRKRQAVEGDDYMLILHTLVGLKATPNTDAQIAEVYKEMLERLLEEVPQVVSVYECRAVAGRDKAFPVLVPLHGKQFLVQMVNGLPYHVAPLAFFQTNTNQTGLLLDMITKAAGLRKNDVLVDLFCGVGSIGISLARMHQETKRALAHLRGFEVYNQSVFNARANAKILGLKHKTYTFKSADLTQPKLGIPEKADVVIADPARAGLGSSVIDYLLKCTARTFVYVACDAGTQARDIQLLCQAEAGYEVASVQICDMFPQTAEVESVVVLKRKPRARQAALEAQEQLNEAAKGKQPVGGVQILDKFPQFPQIVRPGAGTTRSLPGTTRGKVKKMAPKAPGTALRSAPWKGPKVGDDAKGPRTALRSTPWKGPKGVDDAKMPRTAPRSAPWKGPKKGDDALDW